MKILNKRCPACNGKVKIEILQFGQICFECLRCGKYFEADDSLPSESEIDSFDNFELNSDRRDAKSTFS